MRGIKAGVAIVTVLGSLLMVPAPARALLVTIDEIIFQGGGGVDPTALSGTADFSISGNTLTIVLTNTSGSTGVAGAQNLLAGIGFTLPGLTIANDAVINAVAITPGSSAINFTGSISDATWGAANNATAINNITVLGDVTAAVATLQADIDFDMAGNAPGSVDGPDFGALQTGGNAGGLEAVQNSLTITVRLTGNVPADLISLINSGHVVLLFGSPTASLVPEPTAALLLGAGISAVAVIARRRARK